MAIENESLRSMKQYFENKSVFITGATGFVGKYIVYKLLKFFDVNVIYFILRAKKSKSVNERFDEYLKSKTFTDINDNILLSKLVALSGDITLPKLGLSDDHYQIIINNVEIVINSGASIKYNDTLRFSTLCNVMSTLSVIQLTREMKNLQVLIHISTFAVFMPQRVIQEEIYSLPFEVSTFLEDFERMTDTELQQAYGKYIDDYINAYHLTKSISEILIKNNCAEIPVVIIRPSVVMSAYNEPEPGWFQGLQLSTGLMAVWTSGLIRTIVAHEDFGTPIIPVDLLGNFILTAIYQKFHSSSKDITIYNCTTNCENSPTMAELAYFYGEFAEKYPSAKMIRRPLKLIPKSRNKLTYKFEKLVYHTMFSYFADFLLRLNGQKPIVVDITRKLNIYLDVIESEVRRNKVFETHNFQKLCLTFDDHKDCESSFALNLDQIDWKRHSFHHYINYRRRILKESDDSIPKAVTHMKRLAIIEKTMQFGFCVITVGAAYLLIKRIDVTKTIQHSFQKLPRIDCIFSKITNICDKFKEY